MFFSNRELTELIVDIMEKNVLDERPIHHLLYLLQFPTSEVPLTIAEVLCSNGELLARQEKLGKRLAWGHIEELSQIRDVELRANRQLRIGRQLNRIVLYLASQKAPSHIGEEFSALLERFIHILYFFECNKDEIAATYAAEEVLLIEKMFEALGLSAELGEKFLIFAFRRLKPHQSKMVALKLARRLDESEGSKNCSEEGRRLLDPTKITALSSAVRVHPTFAISHNILGRILENFAGPLPKVH